MQKQEVREAVELPLTHFNLYKQIGIDPPRGVSTQQLSFYTGAVLCAVSPNLIHCMYHKVLFYGPPGTGKTMLAKAVANATNASFIQMVGSEFVQKYLGEVCFLCAHLPRPTLESRLRNAGATHGSRCVSNGQGKSAVGGFY